MWLYLILIKRDNGVTAQARIYAKYKFLLFIMGPTTEVSYADFQETGVSIAQIPSLPAGKLGYELGDLLLQMGELYA